MTAARRAASWQTLVLSVVLGVAAGRGMAQEVARATASDSAAILAGRAYVEEARTGQVIPGVQVAVMRRGLVVWSEGFGIADLEQGVPVSRGTRFRVGSVTKPMTATALAVLSARGRIDLDSPIQRYVPHFQAGAGPITARMLLGHLAGIRHYTDPEDLSTRRFSSMAEAVSVFADDSLLYPPGTRFSYSSYGYVLVGAAIEESTGEPFTTAMKSLVFEPSGMTATTFDIADTLLVGRAHFYHRAYDGERWVGPITNAPFVDLSNRWAAGGVLSTAEDLVRFGDALLRHRLIDGRALRALWTPQRTAAGSTTGYGLGFFLGQDGQGRRRVFHGGNSTGSSAKFLIYPDDGVVVAVLWNADFGDFAAGRLAEPFLAARPSASP
jgi:serine beta-lactamase-like protein LACTB, mitochondrial